MGAIKKYLSALIFLAGALLLCSCDGGDKLYLRNNSEDTAYVKLFYIPIVTDAGDTIQPQLNGLLDQRVFDLKMADGSSSELKPDKDTVKNTLLFKLPARSTVFLFFHIGFSAGNTEEWGFNAIEVKSKRKYCYYEGGKMLELTSNEKHSMGLHDYYIEAGAHPE